MIEGKKDEDDEEEKKEIEAKEGKKGYGKYVRHNQLVERNKKENLQQICRMINGFR